VQEVNAVSECVTALADPSANVIFGAVVGPASPHHRLRFNSRDER